ncbi:MAG: glycosyltransferase family 4 protein [Planctomycetota bacterium]|jgi:glycosyltransferase involved in cell wall biosynthesis
MKICYLCSDLGIPLHGSKGASAHIRGFVRALKQLGHQVLVVTSSADGDAGLGVPLVIIPRPDFLSSLPMESYPRMVRALSHTSNNVMTEAVLKEVLEDFQPGIIYERYSPFAVAGSIVAAQRNVPHILEVNALLSSEGKTYRKQALGQVIEVLEVVAFEHTSSIIAVSTQLRESLVALGVSPDKITVVPNGVDEMFFAPAQPALSRAHDRQITIGFVGSLKPWHGIDLLTDCFRRLSDDPAYHLLVVGDGPERKLLKQLAEDLPGRVTLAGAVKHEEVPRYLAAVDVALAPYPELETFYFSPLKTLEYMAAGKAIVATEIGQVKDLIEPERTGLLVPPGDKQRFKDEVERLANDRGLRERLGKNAAEEARRAHTWRHRARFILETVATKTVGGKQERAQPVKVK